MDNFENLNNVLSILLNIMEIFADDNVTFKSSK